MEYLLVSGNTYKLYHSLRRLCVDNGIKPDQINKDLLPCMTPAGMIIALTPDTRV